MKLQHGRCWRAAALAVALVGLCFVHSADAPRTRSPIEGIWEWDFTMPDGAKVTPRLRFRVKSGELIGTSRFRRGSETPVKNLSVRGREVSFDVVREREDGEEIVTHYRGRIDGDTLKGKITSKSGGGEQSHDWVAHRVSPLEGVWTVRTDIGQDKPIEAKLTLQQDGEKLSGKISGSRRGRDLDIQKGRFKDGRISFETSRRSSDGKRSTHRYQGRMDGDTLVGKVEMDNSGNRETNKWEAVRAD